MARPCSNLFLRTALALAVCLVGLVSAPADDLLPKPRPVKKKDKNGKKPQDPPGSEIIDPNKYPPGLAAAVPVTFVDVLRLAILGNLDITQANLVVDRAKNNLFLARAQYLPNLNVGSTYVSHDGRIQRTEGDVVTANRDSLFVGFGPSIRLGLSDAIFRPLERERLLTAARYGQVRVTYETLQRVADAYFKVLVARRRAAALWEVLDALTSEKESPLRGGSTGLLPLIKTFVKNELALPSDQARVEADVVRRSEEYVRALQEIRTSSAELAQLLNLNPGVFLLPVDDFRFPLCLPGDAWINVPLEELIAQAINNRPELAENQAFIAAAMTRLKRARWRPLLPNLVLNYNWGGFGGGPDPIRQGNNVVGRTSSGEINNFGTRGDFDISLVWTLQNMGLGNLWEIRDSRISVEQQTVRGQQLLNLILSQVVRAQEAAMRGEQRVRIEQSGLFDEKGQPVGAIYRSLRLNFVRIKGGQGTPLEVLDSTRRLFDNLVIYSNALTDYDRARFRLLTATAMPVPALLDFNLMPQPPKGGLATDCAPGQQGTLPAETLPLMKGAPLPPLTPVPVEKLPAPNATMIATPPSVSTTTNSGPRGAVPQGRAEPEAPSGVPLPAIGTIPVTIPRGGLPPRRG